MEFKGNIIPVDITVYDLDGQPGLYVHNSFEINAMTEMAGNMSQTSGASVMLMQSAGQQVATDLTGGVVQGISGYFAKNTDTKSGTKRRTSGISCFQTIMFNNKIIYSMKNNFILFLCTAFLLFLSAKVFAQDSIRTQPNLVKIEPYRMEITYDKTTHLIFPAAIRYVDLGSDYLIAGKAEDAENVLRVKSSVKGFEPQTNFSVITDDGRFYSFNIYYSPYPESSSYDLSQMKRLLKNKRK